MLLKKNLRLTTQDHSRRKWLNYQANLSGLELDSIDILELIVNFENSFGIKLNESEEYALHFKNVGTIVDFVVSKKNG